MPREILSFTLRTGAKVDAWVGGAKTETPPLVMIPGVAGNKELLGSIFDLFARDRRVIAPDLSPVVERATHIPVSAVRDLLEILDALDLGEVDLLGQSFGALIATRVARERPEVVRKLVLAGPAVIPSSWAAPAILARWMGAGAMIRATPRSWRPWVARLVRRSGGFPIEPELEGEGLEDLVTRVQIMRVLPWLRRMLAIRSIKWRKELATVEQPVLVIEGSREAPLLPPSLIVFFDQRPNTKYVEIPGGHMPFLVRPDEFVALVRDFLDRVPLAAQR